LADLHPATFKKLTPTEVGDDASDREWRTWSRLAARSKNAFSRNSRGNGADSCERNAGRSEPPTPKM